MGLEIDSSPLEELLSCLTVFTDKLAEEKVILGINLKLGTFEISTINLTEYLTRNVYEKSHFHLNFYISKVKMLP